MEWIDFHAHVLPKLDHGTSSVEVSRNQMSLMKKNGVGIVCATSHFYPQDVLVTDFVEARERCFRHLADAVGKESRPSIILSAEVLICPGMENMENIEKLCYEGTNILLLEMPFTHGQWDPILYETVAGIAEKGIQPVFAHVDRYPIPNIKRLFDMGFKGQINMSALKGMIRKKHLYHWMETGRIVALGSDLHGDQAKNYDSFGKFSQSEPELFECIMSKTAKLLGTAVCR